MTTPPPTPQSITEAVQEEREKIADYLIKNVAFLDVDIGRRMMVALIAGNIRTNTYSTERKG